MNPPELLEVIAEAVKEKSQILDLDGDPYLERPSALKTRVPLHFLPPEIGRLKHLEVLCLADNRLTSLPPELAELTQLVALPLNGNPLSYDDFKSARDRVESQRSRLSELERRMMADAHRYL